MAGCFFRLELPNGKSTPVTASEAAILGRIDTRSKSIFVSSLPSLIRRMNFLVLSDVPGVFLDVFVFDALRLLFDGVIANSCEDPTNEREDPRDANEPNPKASRHWKTAKGNRAEETRLRNSP